MWILPNEPVVRRHAPLSEAATAPLSDVRNQRGHRPAAHPGAEQALFHRPSDRQASLSRDHPLTPPDITRLLEQQPRSLTPGSPAPTRQARRSRRSNQALGDQRLQRVGVDRLQEIADALGCRFTGRSRTAARHRDRHPHNCLPARIDHMRSGEIKPKPRASDNCHSGGAIRPYRRPLDTGRTDLSMAPELARIPSQPNGTVVL